ncbi:TA system antitoxin ParD family protein [Candidatus Poriferisodalis sp.]|uniref:TA system antitoxin ParD family protein n=1 Tax=Candidatus Poriferisodalis sp. TaxID=3101277 RepID=UPI003B02DC06
MPTSTPVRVAHDLHASAEQLAPTMNRSTSQQISFWARIGRAMDLSPHSSTRNVDQVLSGEADYDSLNFFEQAIFRSKRDERTEDRLRDLDLEAVFANEGRSYVELDDEGRVVERPAPSRT